MNVNELASSIHHTPYSEISVSLSNANKLLTTENTASTTAQKFSDIFSDILSGYTEDGDSDKLISAIENLTKSIDSLKATTQKDTDLMSILTDQEKAKEYLSSQSGRELIIEMAQNSIASIIS